MNAVNWRERRAWGAKAGSEGPGKICETRGQVRQCREGGGGGELGNVVQRIIVRKPYLKSEVVGPGEGAKRERFWARKEAGEGWSVGRLRRVAAVIQQVSNDLKWQQKKWHSWEVSGCTWMWDPGLAGLVETRRKGTELHEKQIIRKSK